MARLVQIACAATVILAASTVPLRADPINIIGGSVFVSTASSPGDVNVAGTGGFSLTGAVAPGGSANGGGAGLFAQCLVPECPPGTRIEFDLTLASSGGSLDGRMTIDGHDYEVNDTPDVMAGVVLQFDGSFIAPVMGEHATISAPFSLTGEAHAEGPSGETLARATLIGHGIGTASLVPYNPAAGFPPSWVVQDVRFDFAQPTPEPSTLLLLGTCAVAAVRRRTSA